MEDPHSLLYSAVCSNYLTSSTRTRHILVSPECEFNRQCHLYVLCAKTPPVLQPSQKITLQDEMYRQSRNWNHVYSNFISFGKRCNSATQTAVGPIRHDAGCSQAPCLLYTSPSPRDLSTSRMPSSA